MLRYFAADDDTLDLPASRQSRSGSVMNSMTQDSVAVEPNVDLLRIEGWQVITVSGPYCTAWRSGMEVVLIWKDGAWHRMSG